MALKRLVQAALAAFVVTAAMPASAQQVLKVGSTPTGVPFTFLDTKTNSIQGIMVDLITEIGKDAGFQVQIEPMQFSTLIASLTSNKIDIISAAMFVTPARKEVIDFSEPFYSYGEGLLVPKSDSQDLHQAGRSEGRGGRRAGRNGLRRCAEEDRDCSARSRSTTRSRIFCAM